MRILEFLCSQVHYNLLFGESMCIHGVYTSFPGFSKEARVHVLVSSLHKIFVHHMFFSPISH